jgi:putative intracellular protease/amidase
MAMKTNDDDNVLILTGKQIAGADRLTPTARPSRATRAGGPPTHEEHESIKDAKRGGAGAATICFLIGGHSATSALLEHHLLAALQHALTAAACGLILLAAAWLVGRIKGGAKS